MRAHGERLKRMTIRFVSSARTPETASFLFTRMIGGNSVDLGIVGKGGSAPVTHSPSTITNFARMPILLFAALAHPILRQLISSPFLVR